MAVQAVGIADRYGSNDTVTFDPTLATVSYRLTRRYMAQLEDGGLQCRDTRQHPIVTRIDAIKAKTKTAHVHLTLREVFDAGGIIHVTQDLMCEGGLKRLTALLEEFELLGRERIEVIAVGAHKVAEHRTRDDSVLMFQTVDEFEHIVDGIETETVHTRVEFDMDGPTCDTLLTGSLDKGIHQTEGIDFGFEVIIKHGLEGCHLRIHDHDIGGNAGLAEGDTLVGHSHSEIVDALIL